MAYPTGIGRSVYSESIPSNHIVKFLDPTTVRMPLYSVALGINSLVSALNSLLCPHVLPLHRFTSRPGAFARRSFVARHKLRFPL